ncbi:MAG TPA: hypothetical protein VHH32_14820 [Gemmatimonadales bacterium]|nr:hypothetical protein [Gemmatimonadales bacterium]
MKRVIAFLGLTLTAGGATGVLAGDLVPPARNNPDTARVRQPVLDFPEPGLDDTAAYQGYQTRFYRDSKNNTVQIYIRPQTSRVVLVWADAANESVGFTARDRRGRAAGMDWAATESEVWDSGGTRTIQFRLTSPESRIQLGWFVLGSMRVERDFVYAERHLQPFSAAPFVVAEESLLVARVAQLPPGVLRRHLSLLDAESLQELRGRLAPTIRSSGDTSSGVTVEQRSLDGRNLLRLQLLVDRERVKLNTSGRTVLLEASPGSSIDLAVRVTTSALPLTPLSREEVFSSAFLDFLRQSRQDSSSAHARRLERQVRAVELLSSQEKLMAGLPNFATYFGRDMMMTALMMRSVWSPAMMEHVIGSVLGKLGPGGEVSHEEALGGQAIREHAVIYDSLINLYLGALRANRKQAAQDALSQAEAVLRDVHRTRENYHMIDDEFQLPVLAAWYLADTTVPAEQKRRFLEGKLGNASRLQLLLKELSLVASLARPYVLDQQPTNLVSFPARDSARWRSASWRDSDAGYAGGRFAMDINVIWVPQALKSMQAIVHALRELGWGQQELTTLAPPEVSSRFNLYLTDPSELQRAAEVWQGSRRHFTVSMPPAEVRRRVDAKLAWLPRVDQRYWRGVLNRQEKTDEPLTFLALSLDAKGRPIPIVNTDPATELFLNDDLSTEAALRDVAPMLRPYPVGLFVEGLGPVVANDAYASREIWERFRKDHYHGPRVVWGREVNLLLLGLANQLGGSQVEALEAALRRTLRAVNASGLEHNELWSYEIRDGKLLPVRYGTSSDIQLWNTTDLAVEFVLSRLPQR